MQSLRRALLPLAVAFSFISPSTAQAGTKYFMVFGDSYSTTGSWFPGDKPSARNPIGNPSMPGQTTSGGLNWVGQVTSKLNNSLILTYDFAVTGATTDKELVDTYASDCFDDQVGTFHSNLARKPSYAPWTPKNTLAAVWIGINDVGENFWDRKPAPIGIILDRYFELLQTLYDDGIRNLVLLTIPHIVTYNSDISRRLAAFKSANRGVTAQVFDTAPYFEVAMNNPKAYGARDATCVNSDGVSCLWHDNYHPGLAIHKLVAQGFVKTLTGSFF
ncbi:hypothetical protein DL766_002965 [Monosporascus sp. MC13-8B]|uniref:SGNH hydrolase-type esterase domain-containing protein n=1 Tax=Monosporascus cannonballus TaxID=155416 RepID=A0ABY0HHQ3_9PEZI|nr:hypothetical protein DL763_010633 [Monosporascus cannonballus]RYO93726.1 hypothetical protein DL762_000931 [Monosporascus cannonballus]RYP34444.1 hypothetical protein DL766_002965 [Monosporascus sp. MC13-8B]